MTALAIITEPLGPTNIETYRKAACDMARAFADCTRKIGEHMAAIESETKILSQVFADDDATYGDREFSIGFRHEGHSKRAEDFPAIVKEMSRTAWRRLIDHLGVKNVMSVAKRKAFEEQLQRGDLPDVTEENILSTLMGLIGQAKDFARDAAKEVFDILRPSGHWGGQYKTNDAFRVGRRVILSNYVEQGYGKPFRVSYHKEAQLTALDGVFHLLDGKGVMRENRGPLYSAICDSGTGRGETTYFKFRCFKNRNLHLEMKRLDLVKELNGLAAGEYVLGEDQE